MAIDVYLQIDGIKGESTDERHKEWIECTSAVWSVLQPKSATASTGAGHTAERCEHGDVIVFKLADLSRPSMPSARLRPASSAGISEEMIPRGDVDLRPIA